MSIDGLDNKVSESTYYDRMSKKNLIIELKKANLIIINQKKSLIHYDLLETSFNVNQNEGFLLMASKWIISLLVYCVRQNQVQVSRDFLKLSQ